jgi:mono/diheme cytochrome c family protein
VLLALSSAQKGALGGMAAAFIVFALVSAMVIPHYRPNFPGRAFGAFLALVAVFTVGMLATVAFGAKESEEAEAHPTEATEPAPPTTEPAPPTTGEPKGNPAAGKAVFASAGCVGCHTLQAAGATGTVGPNLDEAKPDYALVVERVTNGMGVMPSFKGQLSEQQIQDVAAYVVESTGGGAGA